MARAYRKRKVKVARHGIHRVLARSRRGGRECEEYEKEIRESLGTWWFWPIRVFAFLIFEIRGVIREAYPRFMEERDYDREAQSEVEERNHHDIQRLYHIVKTRLDGVVLCREEGCVGLRTRVKGLEGSETELTQCDHCDVISPVEKEQPRMRRRLRPR